MISEHLTARPFIHEHIVDGQDEWIISTPLRFIPVVETSLAVCRDERVELVTYEKAEAA